MRGPQQLTLGPQAAQQLASTVKRVERDSRSQRGHRRRSPGAAPPSLKIGVLQGDLAYHSSASVKFYAGEPGSEEADDNPSQTCYPWMLQSGDVVASSTEVVCAMINGYWYVIAAGCTGGS